MVAVAKEGAAVPPPEPLIGCTRSISIIMIVDNNEDKTPSHDGVCAHPPPTARG